MDGEFPERPNADPYGEWYIDWLLSGAPLSPKESAELVGKIADKLRISRAAAAMLYLAASEIAVITEEDFHH